MSQPNGSIAEEARSILTSFGVGEDRLAGGTLSVRSPIDGSILAQVAEVSEAEADAAIGRSAAA